MKNTENAKNKIILYENDLNKSPDSKPLKTFPVFLRWLKQIKTISFIWPVSNVVRDHLSMSNAL